MDVIVVGAGVAGSLAARSLAAQGHRVRVLDKGFIAGGRLASRSVGAATFDVGAQFLTARSDRFARLVGAWEQAGVLRPWFRGSPDRDAPEDPTGHVRWRGSPTMRALAHHLVAGLEVELGTAALRAVPSGGGWDLEVATRLPGTPSRPDAIGEEGPRRLLRTDALVLTAPLPQTLALLATGAAPLPHAIADRLAPIEYDPCLTLLAVPHERVSLPERGAVRIEDGALAWLTDHQASGASRTPAVTVHASAAFSHDHLDASEELIVRRLRRAAGAVLHTDLDAVHLHRWRFATPTTSVGEDSLAVEVDGAPLAIAGDAFLGGRVEGAALSGLDAAARLDELTTDEAASA
ncbi:MAG: NAD(P)/FAD-dependent oxidoreductase [Nitriliruptoraceae bacterium]